MGSKRSTKAYHHRKERHDKVIDFRQAVVMSDDTVITACRNLRELLEEIDLGF